MVDIALDEMLRWHTANLDHSLISTLLRIPDYQMPIEKIRANVKMTIGGGLNEPRDALGVAAWALLAHPEQRRAVETDPSLWPIVFDEAIRWIAPIGLYSRQVTRDTVLAGCSCRPGPSWAPAFSPPTATRRCGRTLPRSICVAR